MTQLNIQPQEYELYHVFVPYQTAKQGGTRTITLRSGKSFNINIPTNTSESDELYFTRPSLQTKQNLFSKIRDQINRQVSPQSSDYQKDLKIVLHTLFDKQKNIESILFNLIDKADIKPDSKIRCKKVYEKIKDVMFLDDFAALQLLDFIVSSSQLDSLLRQQYNIAGQNSRLRKLEKCIEDTLALSDLKENQQQLIKGTYQYIKAGEYNTNFSVINQLDSIVDHSSLPEEIKQFYFSFSLSSKAKATDLFIISLIDSTYTNKDDLNKLSLLNIYQEIRDGKTVNDTERLQILESLILASPILEECKIIYNLMREQINSSSQNFKENKSATDVVNIAKDSVQKASRIVPTATKIASATGMKAGTGVAISTLSGGAATNATLALLGGGSVAAGGLGMLGGLAVATGGAALIGAAALFSIANVTQMNPEEQKKLGIAALGGVASSAAAVTTAWAAVTTFGVASTGTAISTLSGAAAYSAAIAALGGVGFITGGAALVALGAGFAAWKLFQGDKNEDKNDPTKKILKQLEANLYQ